MKKFRVQYEVTLKFDAFVEVKGDFRDEDDSRIDKVADRLVREMDPRDMAFQDEEYEILDVVEIE